MVYLSGYRIMWLFVMFDLPTGSRKERKQASGFRNHLLDLGFEMSQFSVYMKYCMSAEKAESISKKVTLKVPSGGKVDIVSITDRQFANIIRFEANEQLNMPKQPQQLQIF